MNSRSFQNTQGLKGKKTMGWWTNTKSRSCLPILCSGHLSEQINCLNRDRNTVVLQVASTPNGEWYQIIWTEINSFRESIFCCTLTLGNKASQRGFDCNSLLPGVYFKYWALVVYILTYKKYVFPGLVQITLKVITSSGCWNKKPCSLLKIPVK